MFIRVDPCPTEVFRVKRIYGKEVLKMKESHIQGLRGLFIVACLGLMAVIACKQKGENVPDGRSTPEKSYKSWIEAGVDGDLVKSMEYVTEASKKMMDQQVKERGEFMRRMTANVAVFKNYSIVDRKESGDKAMLLTESPDKKGRIAVPFVREQDGWKVDLIKMFMG